MKDTTHTGAVPRRAFAIVAESRLPRQLALLGVAPGCRAPSKRPRRPAPAPTAKPAAQAPVPTLDRLIADMQRTLERHQLAEDAPTPKAKARAKDAPGWLSPTQAGLRYGEICIARSADGAAALVRISSYRAPGARAPEKRPYRRWHGIDVLAFLTTGTRREVRIAQVLKGSRC